jgi:two-component system, sensor histidine kinase RpfC
MFSHLQSLAKLFANRSDSEHQQGITRLVITFICFVYFAGAASFSNSYATQLLFILGVEGFVGTLLLIAIALNPAQSNVRRWLGMLLDYSMMAATMILLGEVAAPAYVLILWVTIGNGLRYGRNFLYMAITCAAASFGVVIHATTFWQTYVFLSWGLLIGLIAIPLYLASLLSALTAAVDEARRANAAKSRFLATMSHELRSPLNGIIGMSELLSSMRLSAEQRECADVIQTSAQTLAMLVEDVLDISAIEAGKLKRQDANFSIRDLVRRLRTMLTPLASAKGLKLNINLPDTLPSRVRGDGGHLLQVLMNLLHNAIKFTESGSVDLEITEQSRTAEKIKIFFSIRDTGIGIPDSQLEKIFQAFEQLDTGPARRYGGSGLGTTIAKTLTELMGGTIGFEKNPGGGSLFWVILDFELLGAESGALTDIKQSYRVEKVVAIDDPFVRHRARVRALKILIADDIAANRIVLQRLLERAGHSVSLASDGEAALDQLAESAFDLAFIDLHMPGISGLDVIRQAKVMQAGLSHIPLVALSADATTDSIREAEAAGASLFLTKPIVVARLLDSIAELIKKDTNGMLKPVPQTILQSGDGFRPEVLRELASMNLGETFLNQFVEQCLQDAERCLTEIEQASAISDWEMVRESAHAMKGISENLGADTVSRICTEVMHANSSELSRDWRKHFKAMADAVHIMTKQVDSELKLLLAVPGRRNARPNEE